MAQSHLQETPADDEVESFDDKIEKHVDRIRSVLAVETDSE